VDLSLSIWHNEDGTVSIAVELADKLVALDRLGRAVGLYRDRTESTVAHTVEFVDPMARIMERFEKRRCRPAPTSRSTRHRVELHRLCRQRRRPLSTRSEFAPFFANVPSSAQHE
jgi:hypothetical protein